MIEVIVMTKTRIGKLLESEWSDKINSQIKFGSISANEISVWKGDTKLGRIVHDQSAGEGNLYYYNNQGEKTKLGKAPEHALHNEEAVKKMMSDVLGIN
jgi:hypothetical protein